MRSWITAEEHRRENTLLIVVADHDTAGEHPGGPSRFRIASGKDSRTATYSAPFFRSPSSSSCTASTPPFAYRKKSRSDAVWASTRLRKPQL